MLIASLALAKTDWHYLEFREVDDAEVASNWFGEEMPIFVKDGIAVECTFVQPNKLIFKTSTILLVETHPFADQVYEALDEMNVECFQIAIDYLEGFDDPVALGVFFRDRADLDHFVTAHYTG